MGVEVQMTDDIRKFQNKVVGPLTFRQLICVGVAAVAAVPTFGLIPGEFTDKLLPVLAIVSPILAFGWVTMDGCPAEMILMRILYAKYLAPPKRKALTESSYHKEYVKMKKKEELKKNGGKEVKKVVKYSQKKKNRVYT